MKNLRNRSILKPYRVVNETLEIDLPKVMSLDLGAEDCLREINEDGGYSYTPFGAVIAGTLTEEEEDRFLPLYKKHTTLSAHYRWSVSASKVAKIEMMDDPQEARKEFIKLFVKANLMKFKEDEFELAREYGLVEDRFARR